MICPICSHSDFSTSVRTSSTCPILPRGTTPLGRTTIVVDMTAICTTCGYRTYGTSTTNICCRLDRSAILHPLRMYDAVKTSYGDGWNIRSAGKNLKPGQIENMSMSRGWADAQAHSEKRGGKAPPKGWGHATSNEYLKTETACRHLKMISLNGLAS